MLNTTPKETYNKISDISLDYLLNDKKIKGLIFDFDGTLLVKRVISIDTMNFIKKAQQAGLKVSVVSNNINVNNTLLKILNIKATKKFALKPFKKSFLDMAKQMNLKPSQIAFIGNNKYTDILGANRSGMYSIYLQDRNSFRFKSSSRRKLKNLGINHIE
jgi:HAD superfamily phosphatase (TIGR01668 family)